MTVKHPMLSIAAAVAFALPATTFAADSSLPGRTVGPGIGVPGGPVVERPGNIVGPQDEPGSPTYRGPEADTTRGTRSGTFGPDGVTGSVGRPVSCEGLTGTALETCVQQQQALAPGPFGEGVTGDGLTPVVPPTNGELDRFGSPATGGVPRSPYGSGVAPGAAIDGTAGGVGAATGGGLTGDGGVGGTSR